MERKKNPPLIVYATQIEALRLVMAGKPSRLQHLVAHGIISNPQDLQSMPEEIFNRLLHPRLNDVVRESENAYTRRAHPKVPAVQVADCFKKLRDHLKHSVRKALADEETRNADMHLLSRIVGETTLGDYGVTTTNDQGWLGAIDEALLIARAKQGDEKAFEAVHFRYQKQVFGFIRHLAQSDADAKDIEEDTWWILLRKKMPTYDPARASLPVFAKYWAKIALLRFYEKQKRWGHVVVLFSKLRSHFQDLEHEEEIQGLVERLSKMPVVPEEKVPPEVYTELLRITFGGSSPPHQLIAFGFVKLIEKREETGKKKETQQGGATWKPQEVVELLSDTTLRELEKKLEGAYSTQSQLPRNCVQPCLTPLRQKMDRRVEDAVVDKKTRKLYRHLWGRIVGGYDPCAILYWPVLL